MTVITSDSYSPKRLTRSGAVSSERKPYSTSSDLPLRVVTLYTATADFLTCVAAICAVYLVQLRTSLSSPYPMYKVLSVSVLCGLCAILLPQRTAVQAGYASFQPIRETASAIRVAARALFLLVLLTLLLRLDFPRAAIALAFILMPVLLVFERHLLALLLRQLLTAPGAKLPDVRLQAMPPVLPLVTKLPRESAIPVPWHYTYAKRIVDLLISFTLLVLFSPAFLLLALLIRLSSPGSALFVQRRVGRNGKHFNMYKFRSMSRSARKYERSPTSSNDPRITKLGRFLRRSSLDELPQLMNVFVGDMSLVGPRPEMPFLVRRYTAHQRQRLQVIPGITGLWQLSPDRTAPIHENLHHDLSYIRNRSVWMDLAILLHTPFFAMRGGV